MRVLALLALVVTVLLVGCSTPKTTPTTEMIHGDFQEYMKRFQVAHYRTTGKKINTAGIVVKPRNIKPNEHNQVLRYKSQAIGYCIPSSILPVVYIDISTWNRLDDLLREELVFHELGHCLLDRDHCDEHDKFLPLSMMRSGLVPMKYYLLNRELYLYELFVEPACEDKL